MNWVRDNLLLLRAVHRACPGRIALALLQCCFSFSYGAFYTLIFFRRLINALEAGSSFGDILCFLACFLLIGLAAGLLTSWYRQLYRPRADLRVREALNREVFERAAQVDLSCYDDPDYFDQYTRRATQYAARALEAADTAVQLVGAAWALVLNCGFIVLVEPGMLALSVLPALAAHLLGGRKARLQYEREQALLPHRRRADYARRCVYLRKYAEEARLTGIFGLVALSFERASEQMAQCAHARGRQVARWRFFAQGALDLALYLSVYGYIAFRYLAFDAFTLGDFASLSGATINLTHFLSMLAENRARLVESGLYARAQRQFLLQPSALQAGQAPARFDQSLSVHGLSFRYAKGAPLVLDALDFTLQKGQTLAVVGLNGSGKSTLIKLLLHLYEPTSGQVLLDGADIRQLESQQYRSLFAVTLQNFQIYPFSVRENVLMGPVVTDADRARADQAIRLAGAESMVNALPQGGDTLLTREFDPQGALLSGGQLQKLAVARALASKAPILILDEPTSALDPMSEAQLFESLRASCQDHTLIFISHRLSSTRMADAILLMERGRLVEMGSHRQLMALGGRYRALFEQQSEQYAREAGIQ